MIIKANKSHIEVLLSYKKKMVLAMKEYDSPVSLKEINWGKFKEKLLEDLNDENISFLLSLNEDEFTGFAIFNLVKLPLLIEDKYLMNISNVFVDIKYRKQGIAKELINYIIDIAKEKSCIQVELSVYKENPAISLYKKIGFSIQSVEMKLDLK